MVPKFFGLYEQRQVRGEIWSGDNALIRGLEKKGFTDFITTNELWEILHSL